MSIPRPPMEKPPFEPGLIKINEGRCPIEAVNPIACWFCHFGHATECHYPDDCQTAECSHLERYD